MPARIMVVDDDGDVREVLVAMLEAHGFEAVAADGGVSMREQLLGAAQFDAIILDTQMPGEQGASLAEYAKDLRVPVIMISGHPHAMKFAYEGRLQLLEKPFSMPDLVAAVRTAIASGEFGQRDTIG